MKVLLINTVTISLLIALSGCTTNILKLGSASTKTLNTTVNLKLIRKNAETTDRTLIIWFIPLGVPNTNNIVSKLLSENDADVVQNLNVDQQIFWMYFIGAITCKATGDVYKIVKSDAASTKDMEKAKYFIVSKGNKNVLYKK